MWRFVMYECCSVLCVWITLLLSKIKFIKVPVNDLNSVLDLNSMEIYNSISQYNSIVIVYVLLIAGGTVVFQVVYTLQYDPR
jgi:hypothetical protein